MKKTGKTRRFFLKSFISRQISNVLGNRIIKRRFPPKTSIEIFKTTSTVGVVEANLLTLKKRGGCLRIYSQQERTGSHKINSEE